MRVVKWGKSLAIRLPDHLVAQLGLKIGDEVELHAKNITTTTVMSSDNDELLTRVRNLRGWMPANFKFNRVEANERG